LTRVFEIIDQFPVDYSSIRQVLENLNLLFQQLLNLLGFKKTSFLNFDSFKTEKKDTKLNYEAYDNEIYENIMESIVDLV
jgi:hypothetical protein